MFSLEHPFFGSTLAAGVTNCITDSPSQFQWTDFGNWHWKRTKWDFAARDTSGVWYRVSYVVGQGRGLFIRGPGRNGRRCWLLCQRPLRISRRVCCISLGHSSVCGRRLLPFNFSCGIFRIRIFKNSDGLCGVSGGGIRLGKVDDMCRTSSCCLWVVVWLRFNLVAMRFTGLGQLSHWRSLGLSECQSWCHLVALGREDYWRQMLGGSRTHA